MVDDTNLLDQTRLLQMRLLYGSYPEVVTSPGEERIVLKELMDSYLYKDTGDPRLPSRHKALASQAPPSRGWHVASCHPALPST